MRIYKKFNKKNKYTLANKDCKAFLQKMPSEIIDLTITSPPYYMGKDFDKSTKIEDFIDFHKEILTEVIRVTKDGGSICWQVGYHVKNGTIIPLDFLIYEIMSNCKEVFLKNRIIWTFGHGLHGTKRFSGRHETILWYAKGREYYFDLESVRIPQKYPGKTFYKGAKKGLYSGNPNGKNPADVWEIPNVKANHIEKTMHPCQFPVALVQRLIRALSPKGGRIFDPFIGSGTTGVAAILESRNFVGCENNLKYYDLANERCKSALRAELRYRPLEKPILKPNPRMSVAVKPPNFK